jgi:iron complex outermembrane receptor protein
LRRRTLRSLFIAGALLVITASGTSAQPTARLAGAVRDTTGSPMPAATVTLTGAVIAPRTAVTTDRGRYEIDDLPAGRYMVQASLYGFEPRTTAIDIGAGAATLDFELAVGSLAETVTVTATKTGAADIQATPIAVTALSAATLQQLGVQSVEGLVGFVPTLTVSYDSDRPMVTIRGIGTNIVRAGSDPSSTIHLDGVYLARPAMVLMDFLNVERVEVLRGPQGTLYGRNSVGGTINIVTREPTNTLETSARLTAGNYNKYRAEGAVSGPLIKDKVMGNFAFVRGDRAGFMKDLNHPDHSLGSEDTWAGRGQLRFVFGTHNELLLSGDYARFEGVPMGFKPIVAKPGFSAQAGCSAPNCFDSLPGLWEVRESDLAVGQNIQGGGSAKLAIRLNDTTTLNSLTAYRSSNLRISLDGDSTERSLLAVDFDDRQHQVSEEVTIVRRAPTLTWIGGAFLFDEDNRGPVMITLYGPGVQQRPDSTVTTRASALFGQATYQMSHRVSLTGGLRYTNEAKHLANTGGVYRLGTTTLANPASFYDFVDRATYDAWTPKVSVQARATPETFFYVSATRGFKSGGFNNSTEPGLRYSPEFAWSYEGGLKNTLAGGRVHVNTAVFYTDLQDLQVQALIRPGLIDISNAASATIRGVELEAAAAGRGVHLAGNLSWLDAAYGPYLAVGTGGVTGNAAGNRLNNAPEWSGSGSAVYEFGTGQAGTVSVRGDASWQSRVFFTPFNDAIETQRAYALVHLRAGFGPRQRQWEIAVYARNIRNTEYITSTTSGAPTAIAGRPGEPREWGTQFTIRR